MRNDKDRPRTPAGMRVIKVTVPEDVASYYEGRATHYGSSVSSAAAPVLVAQARGEIQVSFTRQPGPGDVGRPL